MNVGRSRMNAARAINGSTGDTGKPFWQRNYHEHIFRDEAELDPIGEYILENPANWEGDEDFPANIRMDQMHLDKRGWSRVD